MHQLLANLLRRAGANHLMMLDPHSPQIEGFFDHPVDCLKVEPLFCNWIKQSIPNWQVWRNTSVAAYDINESFGTATQLRLEIVFDSRTW